MKKRNNIRVLLLLTCVVSVGVPGVALGEVTITEVMYNPTGNDTGREWIELYNSGSDTVELEAGHTGWRIHDGANHVFTHKVTLPSSGFVVVATNPTTFAAQYGSALVVTKSALSLNNTSGTLSLLDAQGTVVDVVSYAKNLGGFEDGMSLHRVGDTFAPGIPNPGVRPMPSLPTPATVPQAPTQTQKTEPPQAPKQSQQVASVSESLGAVVPQQRVQTTNVALPSSQKERRFVWHYILGLTALVMLGVASVWYSQVETPSNTEEFDIE